MSSSTFGLTAREVQLKCQHCRFKACTNAGMRAEYVQGTYYKFFRSCILCLTVFALNMDSCAGEVKSDKLSPFVAFLSLFL